MLTLYHAALIFITNLSIVGFFCFYDVQSSYTLNIVIFLSIYILKVVIYAQLLNIFDIYAQVLNI